MFLFVDVFKGLSGDEVQKVKNIVSQFRGKVGATKLDTSAYDSFRIVVEAKYADPVKDAKLGEEPRIDFEGLKRRVGIPGVVVTILQRGDGKSKPAIIVISGPSTALDAVKRNVADIGRYVTTKITSITKGNDSGVSYAFTATLPKETSDEGFRECVKSVESTLGIPSFLIRKDIRNRIFATISSSR